MALLRVITLHSLELRQLRLHSALQAASVGAALNGAALAPRLVQQDGAALLIFDTPITLGVSDRLSVQLTQL